MSILVLVEHDNHHISSGMSHVLSAALQLDTSITFLVAGSQCEAVAEQAAILAGVSSVWLINNPAYEYLSAEQLASLVMHYQQSFEYILAPATTFGKNILPGIAALLDVTQISDVTAILNKDTFEHPIYAGNAVEQVQVLDAIKVCTIRTTAFDAVTEKQVACPVESMPAQLPSVDSRFISHSLNKSERPDLGNAKIIVSGGRGLQDKDKFQLIEQLADKLGAAIGASRAAVDAGFVPNEYQVGQTGRVVAPVLYIAIGISGAVQHVAGMKDSKVIVAINKDADAPIFQIATYGLVGDLFELVPELIEKLQA